MPDSPRAPERLWKYRKWDTFTRTLVVDGDVYFASKEQLNDPFELRWLDRWPTTPAEIEHFARELLAQHRPRDTVLEWQADFEDLKRQLREYAANARDGIAPSIANVTLGVFCLSEDCNNQAMWAHYAASHAGVCVGVRTAALKGSRILPVIYCVEAPTMDVWAYIQGNREVFVEMSRTKSTRWQYEREWRTIGEPGVRRYPGCVDQVVIGWRATEDTKAEVREAVATAKHEIQIFEAMPDEFCNAMAIKPSFR